MIFPSCIGFDIETAGDKQEYALQPVRKTTNQAWVTAASFARGEKVAGQLYPSKALIEGMLKKAIEADAYILGWNVAFDASWCIATGCEDLVMQVKWLDAMLLWRHAQVEPEGDTIPKSKRRSYALANAMKTYYPEHAGFKDFDDFQADDDESMQGLLTRNKGDALFVIRLAEKFWGELNDRQQLAALVEARCIPLVAWSKVHGLKASRPAAESLKRSLTEEADKLYAELLASSPEIEGVNLGSPKQLQKLLFKDWQLPVLGTSKKTGQPSTDKFALFDLALMDPRANTLKKIREAKNNKVKYAEATIKALDYNGDGCVRPSARIFGTYTSRMTYSSQDKTKEVVTKTTKAKGEHQVVRNVLVPTGIALHQWKRGRDYRRIIQAPEGFGMAELDFAGQEFRWMAVASEDETMLSLCAQGQDAHSFMGSQVANVEYMDLVNRFHAEDPQAVNDRKAGKFCNLSYQYRVSAKTATKKARVEYDLDVDVPFIKQTQLIYKQSYPGVQAYWRKQILDCKYQGFAETFAGRRVQLPGAWAGEDAWANESTAINYPIQGTGGDQKYLALAVARNHLNRFDGKFYYELHDGLFFIFPLGKMAEAVPFFTHLLSNLPYKKAWGVDLPIDFPVDAAVGPSWGDLKEV